MEATRRQFIGSLAAAAVAPVVAFLPKDRGPWFWVGRTYDIWNGDIVVDSRDGRLLGVFWEGAVYTDTPFNADNRVTAATLEEMDAWTTLRQYQLTAA